VAATHHQGLTRLVAVRGPVARRSCAPRGWRAIGTTPGI